jgi:error-prone DNA polymerase
MLNCYPLGFYHPATLVKDAQHHGVKVLPVDVTLSCWKCTIEHVPESSPAGRRWHPTGETPVPLTPVRSGLALRLGLKYINGLREEVGLAIERERTRAPFRSIADLTKRVIISQPELDTMAYGGAFGSFGLGRREALWQAAAVERDPQSLLAGAEPPPSRSPLPEMTPLDLTRADYASSGVTTGPQLMAHLRANLKARGILSSTDLTQAKDGSQVQVAGAVIVRQRPGTAKGFMFITLEDEFGISNAIVTPDLFQRNRPLLNRAALLLVKGIVQKRDGVLHVRARDFEELKLRGPMPPSHDYH